MIQASLNTVQQQGFAGTVFEDESAQYSCCLNEKRHTPQHLFDQITISSNPTKISKNKQIRSEISDEIEISSLNPEKESVQTIDHEIKFPKVSPNLMASTKRTSNQSTYHPLYLSAKKSLPDEQSPISLKRSSYSDLVQNSTDLLRNIITSLRSQNESYEISDSDDDDALNTDYDLSSQSFNGKKIPSWACNPQLFIAVSKQNQKDGDQIFRDLSRKVGPDDFLNIFETKLIPYYQKRKQS